MEHGMVHIYCGDGKGKTTAALGLALRHDDSGEVLALKEVPGIILKPCRKCFGFVSQMTEKEKEEAKEYYGELFRDTWREAAEEGYEN